MNVIETRLAGKEAHLNHIVRVVNRHIGTLAITRVELRYSTQSVTKLAPQVAKVSIAKLLREHGLGQAAISVRPHEGPLDDSTGEHVLRLHHLERKEEPQQTKGGLRHWLARIFPLWFQVPATEGQAVSPSKQPTVQNKPAISNAAAVNFLRQAVEQAAKYKVTETSTALVSEAEATQQQMQHAQVIVRLDNLHAALSPMLQGASNAAHAGKFIGDMLRTLGLAVAPTFTVAYTYQEREQTDNTSLANETDVEVVLQKHTSHEPTYTLGVEDQTAMPAPALTIRVLGVWVAGKLQAFEEAFVLNFAALPARFDRNALAQAGFDMAHPQLIKVASNRYPLSISQDAHGVVQLQNSDQLGECGSTGSMYRQADTLTPLREQSALRPGRLQVLVNDPAGVVDPSNGRHLPAMVIELESFVSTNKVVSLY